MPKKLFTQAADEVKASLVSNLLKRLIQSKPSAVALGIDLAAKEDNWGLSLISLDESFSAGTLELLLPHRAEVPNFKKQCPIKPSSSILREILTGLRAIKVPTALAVDIPIGWPQNHGPFATRWSAESGLGNEELPSRNEFEYRQTDILLREKLKSSLFAIGADKIASAAFEWARVRMALSDLIDATDVGFGTNPDTAVVMFETYPAAFVRFNYSNWIEYKTGEASDNQNCDPKSSEDVRFELIEQLVVDYDLNLKPSKASLNLACTTPRSDAFDGLLCALCAWDYLCFRKDRKRPGIDSQMSTPEALMNEPVDADTRARISKEGWIMTRMPHAVQE